MEQTQEKVEGNHVLQTPLWIVIIRGFQFLISLIIVGLCGRLMHDATLDEEALSLAIVNPLFHSFISTPLTASRQSSHGSSSHTSSSQRRSPVFKAHITSSLF